MPPLISVAQSFVARIDSSRADRARDAAAGRSTYRQILRASALIGGTSIVNTAAGILRTKAMALLLGPAGVGVMGLYGSILDLAQSVAGLGVNSSGIRQIAEAAGTGDTLRIARTAAVLRRTSLLLGIAGCVGLIALCRPVSMWTFGTYEFAAPVALLSLAVLFRTISDGQAALIQGMRRIPDLARIGMLSAFFGTAVTVTLVYFLREDGVAPALVTIAAITLVISSRHRRKIQMPPASLTAAETRVEAGALLSLGAAFMLTAILSTGAAYAIRIIVRHTLGFEAAGLYQAAWTLGGLYVGFILQAMGSDFYPRLTAVANDHGECNRVVNEQAHVSLLLAGPGVMATLTFAPLVVAAFYDTAFAGAVDGLRWICVGMALRVIAWPMGFILLAKGARRLFVFTDVAATVVHLGLASILIPHFGLAGATMGFFGLYIWHGIVIYLIVRRLSGFRWSAENQRTGVLFLGGIGAVFCAHLWLPGAVATALGGLAVAGSGIYSWRTVRRLVSSDAVPGSLRKRFA